MAMNFGPGFAQSFLAQDNIERKLKIENQELGLKEQEIGAKVAESKQRGAQWAGEQIRKNAEMVLQGMGPMAETATALADKGVKVGPDHPLAKAAYESSKTAAAYLKQLPGMNEDTANQIALTAYNLVLSQQYRPQRMQVLAPGSVGVGEGDQQPMIGVSATPTEKTVEVPGELGTTRMTESTGGGVPTVTRYQNGQPVVAPAIGQQQTQARPGQAARPGPPAEQGGKPLPKDAQDNITGGLAALKSIDDMEKALSQTGIIRGRISQAQAAFGQNPEAIDFQTARANLMVQAQSIIKGIPSNFDIKTFEKTIPDITEPQAVNASRIEFSRNIIKQLVEDTVSYYKFTGSRIPPDVLSQARKAGIKVEAVEPWDGRGTPTAKSEALAATGGKKPGIEGMGLPELLKLNPGALTPADQKALDKRLKELGY